MPARDRAYYVTRPLAELRRELAAVDDRATRADTMEAALADMFCAQELEAAIQILETGSTLIPAPPVLVNLYSAPHGAPYATGVDLREAFPDAGDYGRALRDLAANPEGFMVGGGAAPAIFVRPAR